MDSRQKMITTFYGDIDEDARLQHSRQGQLEYRTTMAYIHRYAPQGSKVLEIGAGTGRYSIALAREGYEVTAVELVESNLKVLCQNGKGIADLHAYQGDALDLSRFADDTFDVTLVFGPMYHLFRPEDVQRALDEAIRVTRPGGVILTAFLSVYAVLANNYLNEGLLDGLEENFTAEYAVRHFEEQLFTGYDVVEFEQLFAKKPVEYITTVAADGVIELAQDRPDFVITDEAFEAYVKYHMAFCEKRELLGASSHLVHICRKG